MHSDHYYVSYALLQISLKKKKKSYFKISKHSHLFVVNKKVLSQSFALNMNVVGLLKFQEGVFSLMNNTGRLVRMD